MATSSNFIAIIQILLNLIFGVPSNAGSSTVAAKISSSTASFTTDSLFYLINFFAKYAVFAFLFSIAMIIIVVIYAVRYNAIRNKVMAKILAGGEKESASGGENIENPKWKLVQDHINSDDESKWKLAIIEADIILAELLDSLNLPGKDTGEKLKAVDESDFKNIEKAWEAHKIRNAIAHEGSDFLINRREAQRVIGLYQKVFEEFEII